MSSRVSRVLKNGVNSVLAQFAILLLLVINRRVFVTFMDIELLGYTSLFANIFNLLNIAEAGVGGIITFHLYRAFAANNHRDIIKLLNLYKSIYRLIALIVLAFGVLVYFFLPFIIVEESLDWKYIHIVYAIELLGTFLGYFLSYVRVIYVSDQNEYKTTQSDLISTFVVQIVQIVVIVTARNFIVYVILSVVSTIAGNIVIAFRTYKDYPYLKSNRLIANRDDINKWNIVRDVKNYLVHQICNVIYSGTDNIVISAFCGIRNVALYGNYYIIQRQVNSLINYRILNALQASIGNYIYTEDNKQKQRELFCCLDSLSMWIASYAMAGYLLFYQPFITIWLGRDYLLDFKFVLLFSITSYLIISNEIIYKFRTTFGEYNLDRNYMLASAILNVGISIDLAKQLGLIGVQIGTIVALLPILYARMKLVAQNLLDIPVKDIATHHFIALLIELLECFVMYMCANSLFDGYINIVIRILLFASIPTVFNWLYFRRRKEYSEMVGYAKKVICLVKRKVLKN